MVAKKLLNSQLKNIGLRFRFFGRGEVRELHRILRYGENIYQCAFGFYHGGSGLLVVTDQRVILIDKQAFYLNLEEYKYINVIDIKISFKALQATLAIHCTDKKLVFRSLSDARLRSMSMFIKEAAKRLQEINYDNESDEIDIQETKQWRVNNSSLVPRLRPTKFYGVSTQR